jgi:spermidine synthase
MSEEALGEGLYYFEQVAPHVRLALRVRQVIYRGRTRYQNVEIVVLEGFGLSLILDGYVQSTQADEHIYHESLVHPALLSTPNPQSALILGGGEGATLREVLKHNTIQRCVMVDIDGELLELAKRYLAPMHRGSFWDGRAEVVVQDGAEYVRRTAERFDAIILDLTDPHGPEISRRLYSEAFYEQLKAILKPGGVVVSQLGSAFFYPELYSEIITGLAKVFSKVHEYQVWTPSFGYSTNFVLATSEGQLIQEERVDEELKRRGVKTLFYGGRAHRALFSGALITRAAQG